MKTRQQILDATERTLQTKGLARATTKDIAAAAGCAEGTLFNHFARKEDLLIATMRERVPEFAGLLLENQVGKRTVAENLEDIARAALECHLHALPLLAALFADPQLLAHYQERLKGGRQELRRAYEQLAAYVEGEQQLGRIKSDVEPRAVAALLLGACFQYAFDVRFSNEMPLPMAHQDFVQGIVRSLMKGLALPEEAASGLAR